MGVYPQTSELGGNSKCRALQNECYPLHLRGPASMFADKKRWRRLTMSMLNSFWYCGTRAFFGSMRTWTSIASDSEWNGIRIGKRPTNSGIMPNSIRSRASTLTFQQKHHGLQSTATLSSCPWSTQPVSLGHLGKPNLKLNPNPNPNPWNWCHSTGCEFQSASSTRWPCGRTRLSTILHHVPLGH